MDLNKKNLKYFFYLFVISHIIIWTSIPSFTNNNLPLDTIEALAWGSNLDWGFDKHPPASAFFVEIFFQIFGAQDWAFYLLSSIFVVIAFYYVFKFALEIFGNLKLSLISVLLLESIYFYNFTTQEFNVNVSQLPFWSLVVYYSWRIYDNKDVRFFDCILVGLFAAIGFLSKYLFIYLLVSIDILFIYLIFFKKNKKFDFKYLITIEVFLVLLIPHFIWLLNNEFVTVLYGLKRAGLEQASTLNHLQFPIIFLLKQIGILIPFFFLIWLLVKKYKFKINLKDKKLLFLLFINILPIFLMFMTSVVTGSKIRTMWMTPFYLFFGVLFVYLFQSQINPNKIKSFLYGFLFLFFLSPVIYSYISISQTDKRTDYPGKEVANLVKNFYESQSKVEGKIEFIKGDEWIAGNLSYHLNERPKWIYDKEHIYLCNEKLECVKYE